MTKDESNTIWFEYYKKKPCQRILIRKSTVTNNLKPTLMGKRVEKRRTAFSLNSGKTTFMSTDLYFSGSMPASGVSTGLNFSGDVDEADDLPAAAAES